MDIKGGGVFGEGAVAGVNLPTGPRTAGGVFGKGGFSGCGCGQTENLAESLPNFGVDLTKATFAADPLVEAERDKWDASAQMKAGSTSTSLGGVIFVTVLAGVAVVALAKMAT